MSLSHLISRFSICAVKQHAAVQLVRNISMNACLHIRPTPCLYREPLKKRKKLDPGALKAKEEKRKRKIEKEIKRLSKFSLTLKPIEELQLPLHIQDQREQRMRGEVEISPEDEEQRALLLKEWSRRRLKQQAADLKNLKRIDDSQSMALNELRNVSEDLYQAAIQFDENVLSVTIRGPPATQSIKDYGSPDGDYTNTSFKWD